MQTRLGYIIICNNSSPATAVISVYKTMNQKLKKYRVRQRVCSLTHSARTPRARDRNNFLGRGFFWGTGEFFGFFLVGGFFWVWGFFWGGRALTQFFFKANLLVRVKLVYPPNFNFLGKTLLGEM